MNSGVKGEVSEEDGDAVLALPVAEGEEVGGAEFEGILRTMCYY